MKIGIFGDSFAADNKMNPTDTWVDLIRTKHDVTNYAISGSNLFYSVKQFKQHADQFDKTIFIVTTPGRIKLRDMVPVPNRDKRYISGPSSVFSLIKEMQKLEGTNFLLEVLEIAKGYYMYIQDEEHDAHVHSLMIQDIKKDFNGLMIPIGVDVNNFGHSFGLTQIYFKENYNFIGNQHLQSFNTIDIRNCHMTYENNMILGNKILDFLETNEFSIDINEFVTPNNKDFYLKD